MKHPWKAQGTLSPHPSGARAISCRPACCLHLRALSAGSPGGRSGQMPRVSLPGRGEGAQAGLHWGWERCVGVHGGNIPVGRWPWAHGVPRSPSSAGAECHDTGLTPRSCSAWCHPCHICTFGLTHNLPKACSGVKGSRHREPRAVKVAPPLCHCNVVATVRPGAPARCGGHIPQPGGVQAEAISLIRPAIQLREAQPLASTERSAFMPKSFSPFLSRPFLTHLSWSNQRHCLSLPGSPRVHPPGQ